MGPWFVLFPTLSVSTHTHTHTLEILVHSQRNIFFLIHELEFDLSQKEILWGLHSLLAYVKNCCMFLFRRIFCPLLQYIQKKIAVLLCEQKACIWQNLALKTIAEHMEPLQCIWSFHQEGGVGRVRRTNCE